MVELAPYLEDRTKVIVNGVDLDLFRPAESHTSTRSDRLRMLVLGQLQTVKNPFGLLEALAIVRRAYPSLDLVVDWYGEPVVVDKGYGLQWGHRNRSREADYYVRLKEAIAQHSLQDRFLLHQTVKDVTNLYQTADVACLPSFFEGTSNFICEAMASGVPVLASRVGDNCRLVEEGRNGLLFNPRSPRDIADAIGRFAALPQEAKVRMGQEGRKMAEIMLSRDVFLDRFTELIEETIACRGRTPHTHA